MTHSLERLAAIATTAIATQQLQILGQSFNLTLWLPKTLADQFPNAQFYHGSLKEQLTAIWSEYDGFIFGLATGAVVRLIAPLLKDKTTDPAIVVIDENGKVAISLSGGHQGGADQLTEMIAHLLDAKAILTGASNALKLPGIDVLGQPYGWGKGKGNWTEVSAAIARQKNIAVIQDAGSKLWQKSLPENHPFSFDDSADSPPDAKIWITAKIQDFSQSNQIPQVQWHPRILWLGIGCERGTSHDLIELAINQTLAKFSLAKQAIAGIATIDIKADEIGILEYCHAHNLPLKLFNCQQLQSVKVPNPSTIVNQEVGTSSVAEASALLASKQDYLLVSKQIIKSEKQPGAVTLAIAASPLEYLDKTGKLWLIGTGPGNLNQITPAAKIAINQADLIIGYGLYLDLIAPLKRPGQIVESFPMTQERQRAERAIELAEWGLTVAVVSSGDCGIYGMAGLVLETLQQQGWDGKTPQVEVFPGISAVNAVASRVGAPLMHDFCTISLSDLLTPWEVIKKRLEAAAMADFVTALYNPKSQKRIQQIAIAQQIFLEYRHPQTPVAIVKSVYRPDEEIRITTLEKMLDFPIDMLTTVIIGNSSTKIYHDWLITPRGYSFTC
jgi:cobalt-precorrin 5A hydrolase/precorrin-3B C17-methyltransferase